MLFPDSMSRILSLTRHGKCAFALCAVADLLLLPLFICPHAGENGKTAESIFGKYRRDGFFGSTCDEAFRNSTNFPISIIEFSVAALRISAMCFYL
jgi:hypothetical protein